MGQHEGGGGELCGLVVILERLVVVTLDVEVSRKLHVRHQHTRPVRKNLGEKNLAFYVDLLCLVTALRPHGLVLRVVEGVKGEVLHLVEILLEEEMVCQVVQHHRVATVDSVGLERMLSNQSMHWSREPC